MDVTAGPENIPFGGFTGEPRRAQPEVPKVASR